MLLQCANGLMSCRTTCVYSAIVPKYTAPCKLVRGKNAVMAEDSDECGSARTRGIAGANTADGMVRDLCRDGAMSTASDVLAAIQVRGAAGWRCRARKSHRSGAWESNAPLLSTKAFWQGCYVAVARWGLSACRGIAAVPLMPPRRLRRWWLSAVVLYCWLKTPLSQNAHRAVPRGRRCAPSVTRLRVAILMIS